MVQGMMLIHGSQICFSSGVVANFIKDLQRVKPTFLPVVPRIFNMLYEVVKPMSHVSKEVAQAAFK
jgi:long-subunit acyl-CoA synthetase (AMP-forming)